MQNGGPEKNFKSCDTGNKDFLDRMIVPRILQVRRRCPVILLKNYMQKDSRLVNGLLGHVVNFTDDSIMVYFDDIDFTTEFKKETFTGKN